MKKTLFFSLIIIASCGESQTDKPNSKSVQANISGGETNAALIANFRAFRDAVYKGDKSAIKKFIDFPIMNVNNEIWYLLKDKPPLGNEKIIAFTEADFDKHFRTIFDDNFIKALLKVKSEILFTAGSYETPLVTTDSTTTYVLYADCKPAEKILTLNLAMRGIYQNGNEIDPVEYNVMYEFAIVDKKMIKFRQVRIAG